MDVLPTTCYESVKRYWRRRKYKKVEGSRLLRKKLKIVRLGGNQQTVGASAADDSISAVKVGGSSGLVFGLFGRKAVVDGKKSSYLVSVGSTGEEVDSRAVMEIYKKFAASRARESGSYI